MTRFQSDTLDLSRLPDPTLVTVDYETILADRLKTLKAEYAERGIDYDETGLELDSGVILEEVDAGREELALHAINDAGKANMLAFAKGSNLDQLGALLGVSRMFTVLETGERIDEKDDRFRTRIQLAPEAFATAGSAGAYVFHAMSAHPNIAHVSHDNPSPGEVVITVMSNRADPTPTLEEVNAVRERLNREDIKPITDILTVQGGQVIPVDIEADIILYEGPDWNVVKKDALANLVSFAERNKKLGRDLKLGAWVGRLYRDTVYGVTPKSPLADIIATTSQVIWIRSITLNPKGIDE